MDNSEANPPRACGRKKSGAYYLETPGMGEGGVLRPWTWVLGDGLQDIIEVEAPARGVMVIDLPCLMDGQGISHPLPFSADDGRSEFQLSTHGKFGTAALIDHIGTNNYSAYSFYDEARQHGVSRRVTFNDAMVASDHVMRKSVLPIVFTHSNVPVFGNKLERDLALVMALECYPDGYMYNILNMDATWRNPSFGSSNRAGSDYCGQDHYLIPILWMVDDIRFGRGRAHDRAIQFFKKLNYSEQPIGLTWIGHVTHTQYDDGTVDPKVTQMPVVRTLDLATNLYQSV